MTPRVLVCGAGSIGQRHVANLVQLGAEVLLWRKRTAQLDETAGALQAAPCHDLETGVAEADAVVVATATDEHMPLALMAARAGKALFIEKPLSNDSTDVAALADEVTARGLVCEIGCQLRAHPALRALAAHLAGGEDGRVLAFRGVVGQRLDEWRPGTDYRKSYSADASKGGGALFDLIHEIDLALWMVGRISSVTADLRQVSDQEIAADDLANLVLVADRGAAGQLQLDMLSPAYRRNFEVVSENAVFLWDYTAGSVRRADRNGEETFASVPRGFQRNDLFLEHMRHFLDRLTEAGRAPLCGLRDGVMALDIALAARRSAETGQRTAVPLPLSTSS